MRLILSAALAATAIDNGLARTPPMGWRSWNCYGGDVNQTKMESVMDRMAERVRMVDGKLTSLKDLGYVNCGLDDNWQACKAGVNGSFHDADGNPIINTKTFPDLKAMTDHAHSLGLRAGWYMNNCICSENQYTSPEEIEKHMKGDVAAIVKYGFDGVKLDGCSQFENLTWWADLLNQTGKAVLIENCHWGGTTPGGVHSSAARPAGLDEILSGPSQDDGPCKGTTEISDCPYNFYRTSGDITNTWTSMVKNLQTTTKFQGEPPLARPGAWAYPDMLEVGRLASFEEDRAHFGAWCIISAPLVLGHDMNDKAATDRIWPIISNKEAIAVNQAWAGHPGKLFKAWNPSPSNRTFAWGVSCDDGDKTQQGWMHDSSTGEIKFAGMCAGKSTDSSSGPLVEMQECSGADTQKWEVDGSTIKQDGKCLDVYNFQGPVVQLYGCNGGKNQEFTVTAGLIKDGSGQCLAARSGSPEQTGSQMQLWTKPLGSGKTAVLLLNDDTKNHTVSVVFQDLGLGAKVQVRDIWAHKDLGVSTDSFTTDSFGAHDSRFYVLQPAAEEILM